MHGTTAGEEKEARTREGEGGRDDMVGRGKVSARAETDAVWPYPI